MKKNFFKKLSFVLALAMIVTALAPAAGAFAASAPKLNVKSTKYLYLGTDKDEFDFNISNKQKGWKYLWSSANEDVATVNEKNGLTTATGAGTTTISVVITDADGEEYEELTATVTVRDNIKTLTISNAPTDNKLAVGASFDFNRSYVTVAGKKSGSKAVTRWEVSPSEGATITDAGLFTATAAGEYTITARAFQSKAKYTSWLTSKDASLVTSNEATVKVTVAASMTGVKQTALATAEVTFDSVTADVAKNLSVYQLVGTTKVKQLVKEVKFDDVKKVATVTMYVNFTPEATYVVDYPNMKSVQFVAARTKAEDVKTMEITTKNVVLNNSKVIEYKLFNAEGVDITTEDLKLRVTMTSTGEANTAFIADTKTLWMYKKDVTTTVKAVYHTYKYNTTTGVEEGNVEAAGVITCVDATATNITGLNAWSIKDANEDPAFASPTHTISAETKGKRLYVKLDTLNGTTKDTVNSKDNSGYFDFTSSDPAVAMIDTLGNLVVNKEGTTVIVVKYATSGTKVAVATVELTVGAKSAASQFTLSAYEFTLSNDGTLADNKVVTLTVKNQLGEDFPYTKYSIKRLSGPANGDNVITPVTDAAYVDGKITFNGSNKTVGTYAYQITVGDLSRVVSVTVAAPSTGATTWKLDLSATSVDVKAEAKKVAKDVTINLYGYADNNIKATHPTFDGTAFKLDISAPKAANDSLDNRTGVYTLVATPASGAAIVKVPTGNYKVTASRMVSGVWVPVDTQYFTVTDSQVAPVLAEVKTKLYNARVTSYAATSTELIQAVKDCYKFTLNGTETTNVVEVEGNGTEVATYVTWVKIREYIQIDKNSTDTAYIDHKITIGDYITLKP